MTGRKNDLPDGDVSELYRSYEDASIESLGDFHKVSGQLYDLMNKVSDGADGARRRFAFRGAVNASWPLHSSLFRRLSWKGSGPVSEAQLRTTEREIMTNVHRWGLHRVSNRLSIMEQLAMLQHYGAPTRLIDITFDAYVALWFAVERDEFDANGRPVDGRFFAFDVTNRLINDDDRFRSWEHSLQTPWALEPATGPAKPATGPAKAEYNAAVGIEPAEWISRVWAWEPPNLEARISAQQGAFLFGGVPDSTITPRWRKPDGGYWGVNDVRRSTSVALRFHHLIRDRGFRSADAAYTLRVSGKSKGCLRDELLAVFGYSHGRMFPDFPGFRDYGTPDLPTRPPAVP